MVNTDVFTHTVDTVYLTTALINPIFLYTKYIVIPTCARRLIERHYIFRASIELRNCVIIINRTIFSLTRYSRIYRQSINTHTHMYVWINRTRIKRFDSENELCSFKYNAYAGTHVHTDTPHRHRHTHTYMCR